MPPVRSRRRVLVASLAGLGFLAAMCGAFFAGLRSAENPPPFFQRLTFRRGTVFSAQFAPDGQTILYSAAWDGQPIRTFSARPGSPESSPLALPDANLLAISPSGEMAVGLDYTFAGTFIGGGGGTLARAPLAGGTPRQLLENVQQADWAPDGSSLAVVRFAGGRCRLEFPIGKVLYETSGWIGSPRVAPKGDLVAFVDHEQLGDDRGSVAVVDRAAKKTTLSGGWTSLRGLAWSSAGDEIWFDAGQAGMARALYSVTLAGRRRLLARVAGRLTLMDIFRDGRVLLVREDERIVLAGQAPGEVKERDLSWLHFSIAADLSADGKTILIAEISSEAVGANYAVYLRKTDGSPAVRLGEGQAGGLSPDGKWALAMLPTSPGQLVLLPTGVGESKVLPRGPIQQYHLATWFPDGKRVVFAATEPGRGVRLYAQRIDSGEPRAISAEGVVPVGLVISPDGESAAAGGPEGKFLLYPTKGGNPRPVPGLEANDVPVRWAADGRSLYLFHRGALPARIYRLDLATQRKEIWKEIVPSDPAGNVDVGPVLAAPEAGSYAYSLDRALDELYLVKGLR